MVNIKSFNISEDNFVLVGDIFVATIQHNLNRTALMVTCSNEVGSVVFDYEKPDNNHIHIKLLHPENITVNVVYV